MSGWAPFRVLSFDPVTVSKVHNMGETCMDFECTHIASPGGEGSSISICQYLRIWSVVLFEKDWNLSCNRQRITASRTLLAFQYDLLVQKELRIDEGYCF